MTTAAVSKKVFPQIWRIIESNTRELRFSDGDRNYILWFTLTHGLFNFSNERACVDILYFDDQFFENLYLARCHSTKAGVPALCAAALFCGQFAKFLSEKLCAQVEENEALFVFLRLTRNKIIYVANEYKVKYDVEKMSGFAESCLHIKRCFPQASIKNVFKLAILEGPGNAN